MKNDFAEKMFAIALAGLALICLASCYAPSPLYGTWADNTGNKIVFMEDLTCRVTIKENGETLEYDGSYSVAENVISFNCTLSNGETMNIVTEWDIRGSILYITWTTADRNIKNLSLYHTK